MDDRYNKLHASHKVDGYFMPDQVTKTTLGDEVANRQAWLSAKAQAIHAIKRSITDIEELSFEDFMKLRNKNN